MAPDANWTDRAFTGHAFVCIQLKTAKGVSEDCFGFYLRKSGKALVGGPGVVDREFDFSKTPPVREGQGVCRSTDDGGSAPAQSCPSSEVSTGIFRQTRATASRSRTEWPNWRISNAGIDVTDTCPYLDALRKLNPS